MRINDLKKAPRFLRNSILGLALFAGGSTVARADEASDLAKQLANPVANLISVPFQLNYDSGFGTADGYRWVLNIQPVIPIPLNDDWILISRTIIPLVNQNDVFGFSGSQSGLGDIVQSFFFSPSQPTSGGLIWGVGPVILAPTATDTLLGADNWGAGPTGVVLAQRGPWTYGALANHIWSIGNDDISLSFVQPFVSYTTPEAWTFALNAEASYNWNANQWAIPINASVSKLTTIGSQPVSLTAAVRYHAEGPAGGAEDFGGRLTATFLFPTK